MKTKSLFLIVLFCVSCSKQKNVNGTNGMVVSTSAQASKVGIEILKQGGNAIDAAAAVGFTLAVTSSSNGNLGGGGFMVTRMAGGETFTLDYREMAPESAYKDLFLDSSKNVIEGKSTGTHYASGIPGSVDGLLRAWMDHGSGNISINQLLESAINYAENGFELSKIDVKLDYIESSSGNTQLFVESKNENNSNSQFYTST